MSSSTYLFIQLLISAWTNVYLFYTLMSNPVLCFYFIVYIAPTDHWKGFQIGTVCFLSTSLLSGTKRCSRLILYFLCPSCRLFPRSYDSFYQRIVFRNQNVGAMCAHSYLVPFFSGPLSDRAS